ncbi:hypothetical protein [Leptolyngbya ohadii]|uniref:hypothetical protein n=1 Tax=Leptolyngbya ohadii TaxID=1962290 RepID=UPI00117B6F2A|nr:hypothetical protein [Leptolyngbya ohadii]
MSKPCPKCNQPLSIDVDIPSAYILSCPNCDYSEAKLLLNGIKFSLGTRLEGISIDVFRPSDFDNAAEGIKPNGETIRFILPSCSYFVPYANPNLEDDQ